jgi:hypothetical protein
MAVCSAVAEVARRTEATSAADAADTRTRRLTSDLLARCGDPRSDD